MSSNQDLSSAHDERSSRALTTQSVSLGRLLRALRSILRKRHSPEWSRLLRVEHAQSPEERRFLVIEAFCRLAGEALVARPTDPRSWPPPKRLAALHASTMALLSSCHDQDSTATPEGTPDDGPAILDLPSAAQTLERYIALQQAIQQSPVLDSEPLRILVREHHHLQELFDEALRSLRHS
jgi:hypothetical protein